jgi:uncharacterized protein YndB with AHSA1/START domain
MGSYRAEAHVDASVERTFEVFIDASRFSQWQALAVGLVDQTGLLTEPGASVRIDHGPGMKRTMTIVEADPPNRLRYRQLGMGFDDTTTAVFEPDGAGTLVTLSSDLVVAGGPFGRALEWLGGRTASTQKEYQEELDRFAAVASRRPVEPGPLGSIVTADCGVGFRVLKILAVDHDVVHVGLLPGVSSKRPVDLQPYLDGESRLADPLSLRPLPLSVRASALKIVSGQPMLRLDGGIGVPHLAMTADGFSDARPEPVGEPMEVWESENAEVESWRQAGGPVLGRDIGAGITTLMTVKTNEGYGAAKLLHADRKAVHVRVYSDRWSIPPDDIDPWSLRLGRIDEPVIGIGHVPMTYAAFARWEPKFDRLVMLAPSELDGYRAWLEAGGGVFF